MSENTNFSFTERVHLNDQMAALPEGPYIRFVAEGPGTLPEYEVTLPNNLAEHEAALLDRFDDETLSDLAFHEWSQELLDYIEERAAVAPGQTNIAKGDFVQLVSGEITKVQKIVSGVVQIKKKNGQIEKITVTRLARIGKHKGKPAFGFLSPRQD